MHSLIIFDADGTLRKCTVPGQVCPNADDQWELLPHVKEKLFRIRWGAPGLGRVAFGIASNQAGISKGYLSAATAYRLLADMAKAAVGSVRLKVPSVSAPTIRATAARAGSRGR